MRANLRPVCFLLLLLGACKEGSGRSPFAGFPSVRGVVIDSVDETAAIVPVRPDTTNVTQNTNVDGRFSIPTLNQPQIIHVGAGRDTAAAIFRFDPAEYPDYELPTPIYVSRINRSRAIRIDPNRIDDIVLASPDVPGLEIALPSFHEVIFPLGFAPDVLLVPIAPDRLSTPLPEGRATRQLFQVEPLGVEFNPPVSARLPNIDGLRPGATVDVYRLVPQTGRWTAIDTAVVEASGTRLDGALLPGGGMYAFAPRPLPPTVTLIGTVESPSGAPVERAMVVAAFGYSDRTNPAGDFRIEGVPATIGSITVRLLTQSNHPFEQLLFGPLDLTPDTVIDLGRLTLDARQPDIIRPTFTITPADEAEGVSINTLFTVNFQPVPLDERSAHSGSLLLRYQAAEGGERFSLGQTILSPNNRTLVFAIRQQLQPNSDYTVIFSPFLTGTDGNMIDPRELERTFSTGDDEAVPTDPTLFGPERREVEIGETLPLLGVGFDGSASVTLDGDPVSVLSEDPWTITIEIPDRAAGANLDLRAISAAGAIPEKTPVSVTLRPTLTDVTPNVLSAAGGETITLNGTALGTAELDFNGVLVPDVASVDTKSIEAIVPPGTLSGPLTITVGGVRPKAPLYFVTPTAVDATSPTVVESSPSDGASDVARRPTIRLTFSERLSRDSFFVVSDGIEEVAGTLRIRQDGDQAIATFVPLFDLAPQTEYVVTASGGIIDLGSNPLDQDADAPGAQAFISRFTTQD